MSTTVLAILVGWREEKIKFEIQANWVMVLMRGTKSYCVWMDDFDRGVYKKT